jgi:hypothetical protein
VCNALHSSAVAEQDEGGERSQTGLSSSRFWPLRSSPLPTPRAVVNRRSERQPGTKKGFPSRSAPVLRLPGMKILTDPRSGSYQGITSSRNRYGQYVRTRAVPVQPRTVRQGQVRGGFGIFATQWRGLTYAARGEWSNMAQNYSYTDSLGQGYTMTGFQFYVSVNSLALLATTNPFGVVPPTHLASFVMDPSAYRVIATAAPVAMTLEFEPTPLTLDRDILVQSTGPVSPGITSPPGPHYWRHITSVAGPAPSPAVILTQYQAHFGPPRLGQVIFFRFAEYDELSGRRSSWAVNSWLIS